MVFFFSIYVSDQDLAQRKPKQPSNQTKTLNNKLSGNKIRGTENNLNAFLLVFHFLSQGICNDFRELE